MHVRLFLPWKYFTFCSFCSNTNSMFCLKLCIWMGLAIRWVTATILCFAFFFGTCDLNPQLLEPKACSAHSKCHNKMGWNAHSKHSVWSCSWQAAQCFVTAVISLWRVVEKQREFHLEHSNPYTASWQNFVVLGQSRAKPVLQRLFR